MISEANFSGSFTTKVVPSSALEKEKRTVRTKSDGCKRERSRQSQEEMKKADDAVVTQKLGYQPRKLPRRDPTTSQRRAPILPQFAFFVKNENCNLGVSKCDNAPMPCSNAELSDSLRPANAVQGTYHVATEESQVSIMW